MRTKHQLKKSYTFFQTSKRQFNQATLENAHKYLIQNKGTIEFKKNESGFIRMTFPDSVFVPDERVPELGPDEKLRANFWFYKTGDIGLGDESIHDHPRAFQSYIVSGGYEHIIYSTVQDKNTMYMVNLCDYLQKNILQLMGIDYSIMPSGLSRNFQFALNKEDSSITYQGVTVLEQSRVERTKRGQIIEIDPLVIHRVSEYHLDPNEKTLSLNIVRNRGKGVTNIFLPEMKAAAVKTEREYVDPEEALQATDELISLFAKAQNRC